MSEEDRKMMADPRTWPSWPMLPVKRAKDHDLEPGFMVAIQGKLTTVFLVNPWAIWAGERKFKEVLKNGPKKEYKSLDELLADGWVVD